MTTHRLALALVLTTACGLAPEPVAPEADAAATERNLADAFKQINILKNAVLALQAENADLQKEVGALRTSGAELSGLVNKGLADVGGAVSEVQIGATELAEGTCAYTRRETGSGLATGRRQHKPLSFVPDPDPTTPGLGLRTQGVEFGQVDADGDGTFDAVVLIMDVDGDGKTENISLGGDRDGDLSYFNDWTVQDEALKKDTDLLCGSTDHF